MALLNGGRGSSTGALKSVDRTNFVATAGQTVFTITQGYSVGDVDVFLNGVKLVDADDYYAINGSTIVLTSAALANDYLQVVSYNQFNAANTYTKSEADSRYMVASGITPMTSYLRTPNYGVSSYSDTASASLEANVGLGESGVGIKAFGRSMPTNGGDVLYTADNRGSGGRHRFGYWNGTSFVPTMNIDSSGRLTLPLQVHFSANQPAKTSSGTLIIWGNTRTNTGNAYNTTTGLFTAPVAGVYIFRFSLLMGNPYTDSYHRILWRVNGVSSTGHGDTLTDRGGNVSYHGAQDSLIYRLNVGDTIGVWNDGPIPTYGTSYGAFDGYLLG